MLNIHEVQGVVLPQLNILVCQLGVWGCGLVAGGSNENQ